MHPVDTFVINVVRWKRSIVLVVVKSILIILVIIYVWNVLIKLKNSC